MSQLVYSEKGKNKGTGKGKGLEDTDSMSEAETSETSSQNGDSEVDEFDIDDSEEEEEDEDENEEGKLVEADETSVIDVDIDEPNDEDDDSDSDEEEMDDDYLQKMNEDVRKKVIEDFHPELKTLNYEEVEALATVVRDKQNFIIDPLHKTLPIMTRYEKARILGERARQINSGASPMIDVEPTLIDGYLIALKELEQKRIPFIIQRPLPNGGSEYWRVNDLE